MYNIVPVFLSLTLTAVDIQYNVYTFNFEQVFVNRMLNADHHVLATQKPLYLFRVKSCKANFIQSLHGSERNYEQITMLQTYYEHNINLCFSSKFAPGILFFNLLYHCYFPET